MSVTTKQRAIPPSMFREERLMELPPLVRLTGLGLRFYVDDQGRGSANPGWIKSHLWPLDREVTEDTIDAHLIALEDAGYITLYSAGKRTYLALNDWPSDSRGDPSEYPAPPSDKGACNLQATCTQDARNSHAGCTQAAGDLHATRTVVGERGEEERRGGQREEARGSEARGPLPPLDQEPSPFCVKHPSGTDRPCGPCGTARTRHRLWEKQQAEEQ